METLNAPIKKAIVERELAGIEQQIYSLTVSAQVWKNVDEKRTENLMKECEKFAKVRQGLLSKLEEIDKESAVG